MSPAFTFFIGLLLLILFGWYLPLITGSENDSWLPCWLRY